MKVLDLFSGIGGFSLGLERAGMETIAFCEIEPYCRKVLKKHWPDVPIHEDIRELDGTQYRGTVDVVCGGFPCQDISRAGTGMGLDGDRSGLWFEFSRIIREVRPQYAIIENSDALATNGLHQVLSCLAAVGFDAEWEYIPACAIGATHLRPRLWVIAYPNGKHGTQGIWNTFAQSDGAVWAADSFTRTRAFAKARLENSSELYGGANAVSNRMDRLRGLGNAVVPQIPEILGRAIMSEHS